MYSVISTWNIWFDNLELSTWARIFCMFYKYDYRLFSCMTEYDAEEAWNYIKLRESYYD